MATTLTLTEMKDFVRAHFEDFVNNRRADVIHKDMTPDFYDHNGPNKPYALSSQQKQELFLFLAYLLLRYAYWPYQ